LYQANLIRKQSKNLQSNGKDENPEEGSLDAIDSDEEMGESESDQDSVTMGSFVKVERENPEDAQTFGTMSEDEPDYYDINVLTWDFQVSSLSTSNRGC
jgi:hypothetical protein